VATGLSVLGNPSLNKILHAVFDLPHQTFSVLGKGIETVATTFVLPIGNETTHEALQRELLSGENTIDKP
jgi:hypothetical protein